MAYRWKNDLTQAQVTPKSLFVNRRQIMAAGAAISAVPFAAFGRDLEPNSLEEIRNYNNFYEFGFDKTDPARHAGKMDLSNWTIEVAGLVDRPGVYSLADLIGGLPQEERIYRLRCVEAWSMVIPWRGIELADVLDRVGVKEGATHVAFQTVVQPEAMPGVQRQVLEFPYIEGLRLDEARHPLTLLATGLYGEDLAPQNGAPIRLVVPWKYGFKSIKSIVKITLTDRQPATTWQGLAPQEYGFYANVNPKVNHPRWSQAEEREIGGGLFSARKPTLMFNGYEAEVSSLYAGQDLAVDY